MRNMRAFLTITILAAPALIVSPQLGLGQEVDIVAVT
jgi:hypothetical protein